MYVRSISVENFRYFEKAEVDFVYPGRTPEPGKDVLNNVTLLVGVNGAGKTSVLRAVALGVLAPIIPSAGFRPYFLVRRTSGVREANVIASLRYDAVDVDGIEAAVGSGTSSQRVQVHRNKDYETINSSRTTALTRAAQIPLEHLLFDDSSPAYFLLAYGATRRTEMMENLGARSSRKRSQRYQRVAGVFEDQFALMPLAAWIPSLEKRSTRHKEVVLLLNATLPEGTSFTGTIDQGEAVFRQNGIDLPFAALSDGYRAYIGLVADMLYHMHSCCPKKAKLADMTGTVMVDDIDLHLHPEWQRVVVPNLAKAFPNLQFILTSHSPLVAGTLHSDNVRIFEDGVVRKSDERLHGLSADQILTSPYFGHTPPRSPAAQKRLKGLAAQAADSGDPKKAVAFLKALAGKDSR